MGFVIHVLSVGLTHIGFFLYISLCRLGKAWLDCAAKIQENLKLVSWPFLALHGDADPISDVKFSQTLYDEAPSQDKELKVCNAKGQRHNTMNLLQIQKFMYGAL